MNEGEHPPENEVVAEGDADEEQRRARHHQGQCEPLFVLVEAREPGLLDAVRALRDELATLTLTGTRGSVERDEARYVYMRLQALADVARGLTEQQRAAAA